MTKRTGSAVAEVVTFRRSGMRISALLNERFSPINTLVREQRSDGLLTERFGPISALVLERRPVKVRPVKRPEPAVQPSPAGSGLQTPGSDDGPACAGRAPLWDFDAGEDANTRAKDICRTCPMQEWCLAIAIRDKLSGVWGGVFLLNGESAAVQRLSGLSNHRHRFNGEPLCDACVDVKAAKLHRRRELDRARDRTKKASSA